MFSVISRTADQQQRQLNHRIQRATFTADGETPTPQMSNLQNRELTAPRVSEQDSEARVSLKINERFKSLSIRNIKNHSTTNAMSAAASTARGNQHGGPLSRRKNAAGGVVKYLKEIGVGASGARNIRRNFSPQIGAVNLGNSTSPGATATTNIYDIGLPSASNQLTQTLLSKDNSLRKQKEQPETYIFQSKMDKVRRGNLTQKKHEASAVS